MGIIPVSAAVWVQETGESRGVHTLDPASVAAPPLCQPLDCPGSEVRKEDRARARARETNAARESWGSGMAYRSARA